MEEAALELRDAIHLALSNDNDVANNNVDDRGEDDDLPSNDAHAAVAPGGGGGSSEEGTYVSSLSGSLPPPPRPRPSERRSNNAPPPPASSSRRGRHEWQARRLRAATRVECAASDFESALCDRRERDSSSPLLAGERRHDDEGSGLADERGWEEDIVDFLVALLTSVPRTLLLPRRRADRYSGIEARDMRRELEYQSSMEGICFNFACIATDVIWKYYPALEDRHVYDMIDELVRICNDADPSASAISNLEPILRLMNSLSEVQDLERSMYEREHGGGGDDDGGAACRTVLSHMQSKESLRLVLILMHRFICDHDGRCVESSSGHIGYFVGYLLEHFANTVREEMGCITFDECTSNLFEAWAHGIDEHMMRRLNEDDAKDVHALIVRYHVAGIQSALHMIENAESVIDGCITESQRNNGAVDGAPESIMIALKEAVRHMTMVVGTTEVMDKLCIEHDPEIHIIFQPLMSSYARFAISCLHDALLFFQSACDGTHDVENVMILADDLLFRLCRVTMGMEALKSPSYREADDVLALSLLRAVNSQCIVGRARFLLDVAADRARVASNTGVVATSTGEPIPKRRRRECRLGGGRLPEEVRGDMTDIVLACLALSQSNQDHEHPDPSSTKRASCIVSALIFSREDPPGDKAGHRTVVDPLNPWHTIQVRPLQTSASPCDDDGNPHDSSVAYANAMPHHLDTKSSALSRQI